MDLVAVETAILAWVALLTGLDPKAVVFAERPRPIGPMAMALCSWVSIPKVGLDEVRNEIDDDVVAPDFNVTPVQMGNRVAVLQVAVETFNQLPTGPNARAICERATGRTELPASQRLLAGANLGLADVGDVQQFDYTDLGGRRVCRSLFEVRLNATSTEYGSTDDMTSTIESVEVTSDKFEDPTGAPLPDALQITNEVMP
jgi:hypothetical protein